MNIVVLDGHTLNPGDLTWQPLELLGNLTVYERTNPDEVVNRGKEADALLVNKVVLDREKISQLPKLKYIGVMATGYNNIDIGAASERKIVISNVAGYSTQSVAQLTFALILALTNHVELHSESVKMEEWSQNPDFSYSLTPQIELAHKTLGLIGLGNIGAAVAKIGQALGMKIIVHKRKISKEKQGGIEYVALADLFRKADIVSLHCPLTDETKGIVGHENLSLMKKTAFLINTARGPLVDEAALAKALNESQIAGAGLDVLSIEPPKESNPLTSAPNCLITPHLAWATFEARRRLQALVIANLKGFLDGKPINQVN